MEAWPCTVAYGVLPAVVGKKRFEMDQTLAVLLGPILAHCSLHTHVQELEVVPHLTVLHDRMKGSHKFL